MNSNTELYEIHNGKLTVHPHPGQVKAWRSTARFTFIIAGTQGGKTAFLPLWLNREIQRAGHGDYLAATSTYDLFKLKFLPEMRRFFVEILGWHEDKSDRVFWRQWQTKPTAEFDRIILRSASSEGGLESATIKAAVLDECGQSDFRLGAWEAVQRRLSLSQGRVLGGTTPYNLGWLKQEIYDKWLEHDPDIRVIQFPSTQNPRFPQAEYDRAKRLLPDWKFQMFYNGIFTRPAGLIYSDFVNTYREEGGHKVHPFEIPAHWPRYVGIDFGAVNQALVWIAEDPNTHVFFLYREYLEGGKTTYEHVERVKFLGKHENVVVYSGGAAGETQQRRDWSDAGIPVQLPTIQDVESGIDRVTGMIKGSQFYIFDNCKMTLDEIGTYSREVDEMGNVTDKIKSKEEFHLLDCIRYTWRSGPVDVSGLGTVKDYDNPWL